MENLKIISDFDLFEICKKYGLRARKWKKRFAGLLPEIAKRKLYEKKGCKSITEFAAKFGGISKNYTLRILSVHQGLEQTPKLQQLLASGKVSVHLLARVVSVATPENESFLVEQVQTLPKSALETLVRDMKHIKNQDHDGLQKPQTDHESVPGHKRTNNLFSEIGNGTRATVTRVPFETGGGHLELETAGELNLRLLAGGFVPSSILKLQLSETVIEKLLELQQKGIDINELIMSMLVKHEQGIIQEKETISKELKPTDSRYIPKKIEKLIKKEHGTKCSIPTCRKPWAEQHHTQRFSIAKTHDPHFIAPLCRDHHKIAHLIDLKYYERRKTVD